MINESSSNVKSLPDYAEWYAGKTVLVTGATSGLGREIARLLICFGSSVIPCGTNERAMESLLNELKSVSVSNAEGFLADFSDSESLDEMIKKIRRKYRVDILINSAGFGYINDFHAMPSEKIYSMQRVNITSVVELCRAFLPDMIGKPGTGIMNVGSTVSFFPTPGSALYGATKHFILGFTEALHHEMLSKGVHVTGVYPGHMHSRFLEHSTGGRVDDWENAMNPSKVAEMAIKGLRDNKRRLIPGIKNKLKVFASYILPATLIFKKVYSNANKYSLTQHHD
jgi:short-subunit dehydrogenase